jgi:hypothetical protein
MHPELTGRGQVRRFRPGFVYSRRRVRGPNVSSLRQGNMAPRHQSPRVLQAVVESEVQADGSTMNDGSLPALHFVTGISQPLPQPLLQVPSRRASPPQRCKKAKAPARRSVRIAARCWPRGDTQASQSPPSAHEEAGHPRQRRCQLR